MKTSEGKKLRIAICLLLLLSALTGCGRDKPNVILELFVVSPAEGETLAYGKRAAEMSRDGGDPDLVARSLLAPGCEAAVLHSTSWRWERDGKLVLTYLAFSESPGCRGLEPSRMSWSDLMPPQSTDPKKPRPAEIREQDVLAHGIRHLTFLVRYSSDRRLAEALSPQSLSFFRSMCAQLAGRYETAREFEDCSGRSGPQ
jgi:hypothetical protein